MIFPHEEYKEFSEDTEKRTRFSKTFDTGDGKKKLVCSRSPLHHEKEGVFHDIDLTPQETVDGYVVNGPDWTLEFFKENARFVFTAEDGRTFEAESMDAPDVSNISLKGKGIEFSEAWPGVDLYLCIRPRGVEWYKRIKNADAKHEFTWKTSKESQLVHRAVPEGKDAKGNKTILSHEIVEQEDHAVITETFEKKVAVRDAKTRVAKSSDDVQYPVFIDVPDVSVSVGSGPDDAAQFDGYGPVTNNYELTLGYSSGSFLKGVSIGMRFGGIVVAQGATILSAVLKVQQKKSTVLPPSAFIYGVDVDNLGASPWTTIQGKPRTTAKTLWDVVTNGSFALNTQMVTGQVQEIVNRGGWSSGNGMGLVAINTGIVPYRQSRVAAYDSPSDAAPLLEIDFDGGGGGGFIPAFAVGSNIILGNAGTV